MSYLSLPRAHFLGRMSFTTPTANNNNWDMVLDPENVDILEPFKSMSDDQFRQIMRQLIVKNINIYNIGDETVLNSNWNFDGDNRVYWRDVKITGTEDTQGTTGDPMLQLPLQLLGDPWGDNPTPSVIVDNDPTSDICSQIFSAQVILGDTNVGFAARSNETARLPRCYSRWIYLTRNLAVTPDTCFSAVWQQAIPNATLQFYGLDRSPVLSQLAAGAAQGQGLMMRYCVYYCVRGYTDAQLFDLFKQGRSIMNQSEGVVLGTIGVWNNDELGSSMNGRRLNPGPATLKSPNPRAPIPQYGLAPAAAQVDTQRRVVTLDLITAFPDDSAAAPPPVVPPPGEVPIIDPSTISKISLGTATLQVVAPDGQIETIGTFEYDTPTYLRSGGIVEVPYTPAQEKALQAGRLQVTCSGAPAQANPVLQEQICVSETDDRCLYITEGQSTTMRVQITSRGEPETGSIPFAVQQYRFKQLPSSPTPPPDPADDPRIPFKFYVLVDPPADYTCTSPDHTNVCPGKAEPFVEVEVLGAGPDGVTPDAQGFVTLKVTGLKPGLGYLRFIPGPASDNMTYAGCFLMDFYTACMSLFWNAVRVLPADAELGATPTEQITWELVYDKVLRYYYRMYPIMDAHMRLNDKQALAQRASMLAMMVDKSNWDSTLYMPVTREMSDGKRQLLQNWCARVQAGETT